MSTASLVNSPPACRILCFGNPLHGDDGFGPAVHDALQAADFCAWAAGQGFPASLHLAGTRGLDALSHFAGQTPLLLIDTLQVAGPSAQPGRLHWCTPADIQPESGHIATASLHGSGLGDWLALIRHWQADLPPITLLLAESSGITPFQPACSPAVAEAVPQAVAAIRKRWLHLIAPIVPTPDNQALLRLQQEVAALREANAALEKELQSNAETLELLIEDSNRQRNELMERTRELESVSGLMGRAIDTMGELFLLLHPDGTIRQVNPLVEQELGYRSSTLLGKPLESLFSPDAMDALENEAGELGVLRAHAPLMAAIYRSTGRYEAEHELLPSRGERPIPYLIRATLLHSHAGKLEGAVVTASNIAALRERERIAAEREALFRLTTEVAQDAIVLINDHDQIVFWNQAAERIFGHSRDEALGHTFHDLLVPPAGRQGFAHGMRAFRESGQGNVIGRTRETKGITRDGRVLDIEVGVSAVEINGFWHAIGLMRDITERKRAEAELRLHQENLTQLVEAQTHDLRQAKEKAEIASRMKSEFVANISHELRTPMHAILSFSELGKTRCGKVDNAKLVSYFERIHGSGQRLITLINDLLDISKLEAGQMQMHAAPCDLLTLLQNAHTEIRPLFLSKRIRLEVDVHCATRITADAARITQVIINLLSNAVRFSPEDGRIHASFHDTTLPPADVAPAASSAGTARPALCLSIADEGVGIPDGDLELIFEKFVQSSRTKTGAGGTGLGLAICRQIMAQHQGCIRAGHAPQGGAQFEICLPLLSLAARTGTADAVDPADAAAPSGQA